MVKKLFTLNLVNFYYRELGYQNWETDRSQGADPENIDFWTNRQLTSTLRLIEILLN